MATLIRTHLWAESALDEASLTASAHGVYDSGPTMVRRHPWQLRSELAHLILCEIASLAPLQIRPPSGSDTPDDLLIRRDCLEKLLQLFDGGHGLSLLVSGVRVSGSLPQTLRRLG
jgi:hypothetical protein